MSEGQTTSANDERIESAARKLFRMDIARNPSIEIWHGPTWGIAARTIGEEYREKARVLLAAAEGGSQ